MHRMKKTWVCPNCPLEYGSNGEWTEHLHREHGTEFSGPLAKVALEAAEKRTECLIKDQSCPFCLTNPATTRKEFVRHVGRHLEEVALAVLPIEDTSDVSDSDHSEVNEAESQHHWLETERPKPLLPYSYDALLPPEGPLEWRTFDKTNPFMLSNDSANPARGTDDVLNLDYLLYEDGDDNDAFNFDPDILGGGEVGGKAQAGSQHSRPTEKPKSYHIQSLRCADPSCASYDRGFKSKSGLYKHNRKYHPVPEKKDPPVSRSTEEPAQQLPAAVITPSKTHTQPIHKLARDTAEEGIFRTSRESFLKRALGATGSSELLPSSMQRRYGRRPGPLKYDESTKYMRETREAVASRKSGKNQKRKSEDSSSPVLGAFMDPASGNYATRKVGFEEKESAAGYDECSGWCYG